MGAYQNADRGRGGEAAVHGQRAGVNGYVGAAGEVVLQCDPVRHARCIAPETPLLRPCTHPRPVNGPILPLECLELCRRVCFAYFLQVVSGLRSGSSSLVFRVHGIVQGQELHAMMHVSQPGGLPRRRYCSDNTLPTNDWYALVACDRIAAAAGAHAATAPAPNRLHPPSGASTDHLTPWTRSPVPAAHDLGL